MSGSLLNMLAGMHGGPVPPGPGADAPTNDQSTPGPGTCQQCQFWQPGGGMGLGVCTILSGQSDQPADETVITPSGAIFKCAPTWYCKYFQPGGQNGPQPAPPTQP